MMSNFGLYKALDEAGIEYEKTAVGDKYVYENMSANGYRVGGEQSGHIIFQEICNYRRWYPDGHQDDGSYAGEEKDAG